MDAACGDDVKLAQLGHSALQRLGPAAEEAVGPLVAFTRREPFRAFDAVRTLGYLGPKASEPLATIALKSTGFDPHNFDSEMAVAGLARIGPAAVPQLARVWNDTRSAPVRERAERALTAVSNEGLNELIGRTTEENALPHCLVFRRSDRNW
ncbi:MAG: HEAT repeat domain-containing protein [Gemmataceae bacterium]